MLDGTNEPGSLMKKVFPLSFSALHRPSPMCACWFQKEDACYETSRCVVTERQQHVWAPSYMSVTALWDTRDEVYMNTHERLGGRFVCVCVRFYLWMIIKRWIFLCKYVHALFNPVGRSLVQGPANIFLLKFLCKIVFSSANWTTCVSW